MLIIIDKRLPDEVKRSLQEEFHGAVLMEFITKGIVYDAVAGHPDIFFCRLPQVLVVAPNVPEEYINTLEKENIRYIKGSNVVGATNHHSSVIHYNASAGTRHLVHRLEYTDPVILENSHTFVKVPVKQGYSNCNTIFLRDDNFITSDRGIYKALTEHGLSGIYADPDGIVLPGFKNGFIGGAAGVYGDTVYFTGSLDLYPSGGQIRDYLSSLGYRIRELGKGPLIDGGGIFIV